MQLRTRSHDHNHVAKMIFINTDKHSITVIQSCIKFISERINKRISALSEMKKVIKEPFGKKCWKRNTQMRRMNIPL